MTLTELLSGSKSYTLDIFPPGTVAQVEKRLEERNGKPAIRCLVRDKWLAAKPEEIIRQLWLEHLVRYYKYPVNRLAVEVPITFGRDTSKRADIVIWDADRPTVAYCMIEVKAPNAKAGKDQLKSYTHATGAPLALWSNGTTPIVWHRKNPNYFVEIPDLPTATQTIEDIAGQPWTIDTLIDKENERNKEGLLARSLRDLIEDMEDEVLANAGVDVFEEVFKLIFTKLYDELACYRERYPHLRFRNQNSAAQVKANIQKLFDDAKEEWPGVFAPGDKIRLTPDHLQVCIGSLEEWKLFNSNLDVIDDAFEYLVNQSSKGEKGQYFTPRWVIDLCVKMLNPQEHETLIDTACGSAGFTVHAIFHVWKAILADIGLPQSHLFTMEEKPQRCKDYVQKKVFAIDFDEKSVRVARCLNLIAGDGETNVLHLNTLDWQRWDETTKQQDWLDTYNNGWKEMRKLRAQKDDDRAFKFDVLMANPPFAGDIKQSDMLSSYDLAHKRTKDGSLGKLESAVGRDLLFIERNLDFLRPGGRMAVVLPRGRLNNPSEQDVRDFVGERARILAVISIDPLSFKPHTDTKTSVLFVQKWNDDSTAGPLCQRVDDYNIFFATQRQPSKNTSGNKIIARNESGGLLRDGHGHYVTRHDLFNHEGLTSDGIAEAFSTFAQVEQLGFAHRTTSSASHPTAASIKFTETKRTRRLDADYYQPEFQRIMVALRRRNLTLGDVARLRRELFTPAGQGDFNYIEIGSVSAEGFASYETMTQSEAPSRAKWFVRANDVITSLVRPIRCLTALIHPDQDGFICSSGFAVLEPTAIPPEVLFAYLRQKAVCWVMDMHCTASLYPAIAATDVMKLPFLPPTDTDLEKIVGDVKQGWEMRRSAKTLIAQASAIYSAEID